VTAPLSPEVSGCWVPDCASWPRHCYVGMTLRVPAASSAAVAVDYSERVSLFADHGRDAGSYMKFL
jgi:hypothetical protein